MKKNELLQLIKKTEDDETYSCFFLRLLHSYADQLNEKEEARYQDFLKYLYNNMLAIIGFKPNNDTDIFQQLMDHAYYIHLHHLEFFTNEDWVSKKWKKDWKKEWQPTAIEEQELQSFEQITILHAAARAGDLEFLKYMVITRKADINIKSGPYLGDYSTTPSIEFICNSDNLYSLDQIEESLQVIMELGANIYAKDGKYEWTLLDFAIQINSEKWVKILLKYGVDFSSQIDTLNLKKSIVRLLEQASVVHPPLLIKDTEEFKAINSTLEQCFPTAIIKVIHSYYPLPTYGYFFKQQPTQHLFYEEKELARKKVSR